MNASHIIKQDRKLPIIDNNTKMQPIIVQVGERLPRLLFRLSQAYTLGHQVTLEQAAYDLANLSSFTGVPQVKCVAFFFLELLFAPVHFNLDPIYRFLLRTANEVIDTMQRLRA